MYMYVQVQVFNFNVHPTETVVQGACIAQQYEAQNQLWISAKR